MEQLPFWWRNCLEWRYLQKSCFFEAGTSAQYQLFQKSYILKKKWIFQKRNIPHYLPFQESHLFGVVTFSKDVIFYSSNLYFFTTYFFTRITILQLSVLATATLPIYQLVIKWAQYQLHTAKMWELFLVYLLVLKLAS